MIEAFRADLETAWLQGKPPPGKMKPGGRERGRWVGEGSSLGGLPIVCQWLSDEHDGLLFLFGRFAVRIQGHMHGC